MPNTPANKPSLRAARASITAVIPVGAIPRQKSSFFGGDGLGPLGVFVCILLCAAAAAILDYGVLPPPYVRGLRPPIDFYARASFSYKDPDQLNLEREKAANRAPHVYVEEEDWEEKILGDMDRLVEIVEKAPSEADARDKAAALSKAYVALAGEMYRKKGMALTRAAGWLHDAVRRQFADTAILSDDAYRTETTKIEPRKIVRMELRNGKQTPTEVSVKNYMRVSDASEAIKSAARHDDPSLQMLQWQLGTYLDTKIKPALNIDDARTEARQREEMSKVGNSEVKVGEGEQILKKSLAVNAGTLEMLRQEYRAVKAARSWFDCARQWIGLAALAAGAMAVFLVVAGRINPDIWQRGRALAMHGLFCLAALAICRGLAVSGMSLAYAPFVFVGMASSLAFGEVLALLTLLMLSLLAACATVNWEAVPIDGGLPFLSIALLAGGIAAALPANKLRDRWDLLKYGVLGGLTQGTLVAGISLLGGDWFASASDALGAAPVWPRSGVPQLLDALIAYCNGPICGLLVLGSLPLIESLFNILTNIRLFELADMNQPALRLIQLEAPGTFAHTLQVRFLAEPASDAIGAHTRLVSAGVLYHDLGKTRKPEYFVENSPEAPLRHKRLKPSVSALIIISHVKDGIDLAHEYKLPKQIVDFIPEHHGTTLVSYFYHSAVRDAEKDAEGEGGQSPATEVQEAFFRYPGPKPQTRETAIVMLADTIEAASRTLESPSATRLRQFVHDLMMDKMLDNQLDECGLTFSDLALIEDSFLRVLATKFHSRIRYPGQDEEEAELLAKEKEEEKNKEQGDEK